MARIRSIKPQFFTDDELAEIRPLGRLLFIGLWCIADREGRLEDRPRRIKAEVMPFDNCSIDRLLSDLHQAGFVERYEIDGHRYIQIPKFSKHQYPNQKESASTIPAPHGHHASTVPTPDEILLHAPKGSGIHGSTVDGKGGRESARDDDRRVFTAYEQSIGTVDAHMGQRLQEAAAEYGAECVEHCLHEAAENNKRNWRYASAIMKRHKAEGCYDTAKANPRANGRGAKRAAEEPVPYGDTDSWDEAERRRQASRAHIPALREADLKRNAAQARGHAGDPAGKGGQHV